MSVQLSEVASFVMIETAFPEVTYAPHSVILSEYIRTEDVMTFVEPQCRNSSVMIVATQVAKLLGLQSGAAYHSQGFENRNLGSSSGLLGQ